ncbi:aminoglycoside phosphotransferase family protein [Brachybacterium muris]|uniref:aminoglycoside phosphotransferase family protein n=1 Tax=Brachybacterium muris TaxID=219301 RepID=UPI00223C449F|nr:aminoglycoside phosphotransferase family protein [Brachybacterium muris]MCT2295154.1 aminoglycoside phosphotransferase family protein [Brachybacterium muris]
MIDPRTVLPPQLDADQVAALASSHHHWWTKALPVRAAGTGHESAAMPSPGEVHAEPLGNGESFRAWSVVRGGDPALELVVKIPTRPVAQLTHPLGAELVVLAHVPGGLSAVPIGSHEPTADEPLAFVVTTRVPGRRLPAARWDDDLVAALTRQLASLHVHGGTEAATLSAVGDPVRDAEQAMNWWTGNEPEAARTLEELWPAVLRHQESTRPAFEHAERLLVHGDASAANVLVDEQGVPRLVDWEWSHRGDPARDLAFIGGQIHAEPWYAQLDESQIEHQVDVYVEARAELGEPLSSPAGGGVPDAAQLRTAMLRRRAAHLLHEVFFTSAHFHRVAAAGGEEAEFYADTAAGVQQQIRDWLT